jgi:hypothetical protein
LWPLMRRSTRRWSLAPWRTPWRRVTASRPAALTAAAHRPKSQIRRECGDAREIPGAGKCASGWITLRPRAAERPPGRSIEGPEWT